MSGALANEMTTNEVETLARKVGAIVGSSADMRAVVERAVLREDQSRLVPPEVDDSTTLSELFAIGLGAERYIGPNISLGAGCLAAVGRELKTLSYMVDDYPGEDPRISGADLSHLLYSLAQRCDVAAEVDQRIGLAMASAVPKASPAPPARFPNLELTIDSGPHFRTPRAWPATVVAFARALDGEDLPTDSWATLLDVIASRLVSVTRASLLGSIARREDGAGVARKVVSITSRQTRPKIDRRVANTTKKGKRP